MTLNSAQKYLLQACKLNSYNLPTFSQFLSLTRDINFADDDGKTCLHWAAANNTIEMIQLLIQAGADIQKKDKEGLTPLHEAVLTNAKVAIGYLIKSGANVDAKDEKLWTPLHYAVHLNYKEITIALINAGASIKARDKNNASPYYIAAFKSQEWADELHRYYEHIKATARRAHIQLDELKLQVAQQQQVIMQQQKMLADMQAQIQQLSAQGEKFSQAPASQTHQQSHILRIESPSPYFFSSINRPSN